MAVLPLLLDIANTFTEPRFDDGFGFGIYPHELSHNRRTRPGGLVLALPSHHRKTPYEISKRKGGKAVFLGSNVGKDGFQICVNVEEFKPSELSVKTVDNNVVVEGKHEEREDEHGLISRHFVRKYLLPDGYDPKEVVSSLSSDGVLTVKAPPPPKKGSPQRERVIQIQQTGPAHLSVKENAQEGKDQLGNGDTSGQKMES